MKKIILLLLAIVLMGCTQEVPMEKEDIPEIMVNQECQSDADCMKSGCSGTICQAKSADPVMTTCEWREEYTCFQEANCGCVNNKCEWGV